MSSGGWMESLGLHRVKDRYVDIFMHTNVQSKRDYESSQSIGRWFALVYGGTERRPENMK